MGIPEHPSQSSRRKVFPYPRTPNPLTARGIPPLPLLAQSLDLSIVQVLKAPSDHGHSYNARLGGKLPAPIGEN